MVVMEVLALLMQTLLVLELLLVVVVAVQKAATQVLAVMVKFNLLTGDL
jgi:hypothetical protein